MNKQDMQDDIGTITKRTEEVLGHRIRFWQKNLFSAIVYVVWEVVIERMKADLMLQAKDPKALARAKQELAEDEAALEEQKAIANAEREDRRARKKGKRKKKRLYNREV